MTIRSVLEAHDFFFNLRADAVHFNIVRPFDGSRPCVVCGTEYDPSEVKRDMRLCPAHRAVARREKES
jgi:hypothetical protein